MKISYRNNKFLQGLKSGNINCNVFQDPGCNLELAACIVNANKNISHITKEYYNILAEYSAKLINNETITVPDSCGILITDVGSKYKVSHIYHVDNNGQYFYLFHGDEIIMHYTKVNNKEDFNGDKDYLISMLCNCIFLEQFLSDCDIKTLQSKPNSKSGNQITKVKNDTTYNIQCIGKLWDHNIDIKTPFPVKAHFRKQPYGIGRKKIKVIWIKPQMRKGYKRSAEKLLSK